MLQMSLSYSEAGIFDKNLNRIFLYRSKTETHLSVGRKFKSISDQVVQHLLQPLSVRHHYLILGWQLQCKSKHNFSCSSSCITSGKISPFPFIRQKRLNI